MAIYKSKCPKCGTSTVSKELDDNFSVVGWPWICPSPGCNKTWAVKESDKVDPLPNTGAGPVVAAVYAASTEAEYLTATELRDRAAKFMEKQAGESGLKFDSEKPRMDLLDPHAIEQLAKVLTFGADKYAAHNWRKGLHKSRLIAAALRHLFAYLSGQDKDPETGLSHAAHAMCCCMFILGLEHRPELDDRWRP